MHRFKFAVIPATLVSLSTITINEQKLITAESSTMSKKILKFHTVLIFNVIKATLYPFCGFKYH